LVIGEMSQVRQKKKKEWGVSGLPAIREVTAPWRHANDAATITASVDHAISINTIIACRPGIFASAGLILGIVETQGISYHMA